MPGYRPERVGEMIFRELADRLRSQVKDPRVVPISITGVEVSKDLSRAVVSYMPLGGGEPATELREGLEAAARQLRGPIGRALRLRHAPELVFTYDKRTDAAFRVTALIDQLSADRRAAAAEQDIDDHLVAEDSDNGADGEDLEEEAEE